MCDLGSFGQLSGSDLGVALFVAGLALGGLGRGCVLRASLELVLVVDAWGRRPAPAAS